MESKGKKVAAHPKVSTMVDEAISTLDERKGSSIQAIKKFISAKYLVDIQRLSFHIRKHLKTGVERGDLIQTSGKGASGSFKISKEKKTADAKPKAAKRRLLNPLKNLTSTPKRTLKPKKAAAKSPNSSPVRKVQTSGNLKVSPVSGSPKPKTAAATKKVRKSKISLPTKVKRPKPVMAKKAKKPKAARSPKGKDVATSPQLAKPKAAKKDANAKKTPKPVKPITKKKAVSKKAASKDE